MRLLTAVTQVRPAGPSDAQNLAQLCAEHAAYERIPYEARGHAQRLREALHAGRLKAWVLESAEEGGYLGYAACTLDFATLTGRPFLHLDCLYLRPEARGRGLGSRLLEAAFAYGRDRGCRQVQWQTPDWNEGAIRFYARAGATHALKARFSLALTP